MHFTSKELPVYWSLQAGLAVCLSALQSTSCPGTAVFAHLWAPVCAVLLTVPSDAQGQALRQHQAPGGIHKLLDLRQVAGLQERVTSAAAELVATALQVCGWSGRELGMLLR